MVALHGQGMNAEEFSKILSPLRARTSILFVPEGVYPFEVRAAGHLRIGRAWYLYKGDDEGFVRSMKKAGRHLRALIDRVMEEYPVNPERVALLGFSQGGYFAGYFGIRHAALFRGLAVMGARVKHEVLGRELPRSKHLQVLLTHGRKDRAVPIRLAEQSRDVLLEAGIDVEFRSYDCGHHVTAEQLRDLRAWLKQLLSR